MAADHLQCQFPTSSCQAHPSIRFVLHPASLPEATGHAGRGWVRDPDPIRQFAGGNPLLRFS